MKQIFITPSRRCVIKYVSERLAKHHGGLFRKLLQTFRALQSLGSFVRVVTLSIGNSVQVCYTFLHAFDEEEWYSSVLTKYQWSLLQLCNVDNHGQFGKLIYILGQDGYMLEVPTLFDCTLGHIEKGIWVSHKGAELFRLIMQGTNKT